MAHLWFRDADAVWSAMPLNGRAVDVSVFPPRPLAEEFRLGQDAWAAVVSALAGDAPVWVLLAAADGDVRVNCFPAVAGVRVLQDRDEIRAGPLAPIFFSAETLARVGEFPGQERAVYCGRCRQAMENGQQAVQCPQCGIWYHQTEGLPCWTYAPTCGFCPHATALDAGYGWMPESDAMLAKSIVVAGAGGNIGSHFTPHLARIPEVERVVLIDRDIYEGRNVANQDILLRDAGKPKVLVQARRLAAIRPRLEVTAIHAPLESVPLGAWRADLIVACLDSRAARQAVNQRAWRLGLPWADAGVLGSEWLARVNVYAPAAEAPCLECAWSPEDYRLLEQQYPCGGAAQAPPPNGASSALGALAAAMLALECRKMLAGETERAAIGRQATLNARWHQWSVTSFRRNPHCRFDHAAWPAEPLRCDTREMRLADLLAHGGTARVSGHRFVRRLVCPGCGREKRLFKLECSLDAGLRGCVACGLRMAAPGFDIVETLGGGLPPAVLAMTLAEAGLRYGDFVEVGDHHLEIFGMAVIASDK